MYIGFEHSRYLFLLFVIPLLILVHFLALKNARKRALKFANFEAIARVRGIELFSKNIVILILTSLIIFVLVLALSGLTLHREAQASSFSFVLAIDSSRSMEADDLKPNRLEAAKEVGEEFINLAPTSTRIGIVSLSGNSFIEQAITENRDKLKTAVKNIRISGIEGTDVYEAVITSTNLFKDEEAKSIILLSDGQINVMKVDDAVKYANEKDVIIHTIAMGTEEGGKTSYGISKVDKDALKAIAYNTGGDFFETTDKKALSDSFKKIMKLTKKKISINLSDYLLIASVILFILEYILINTRYRTLP